MMKETTLDIILKQEEVSRAEKVRLVLSMSLPAILAQLTSIAMQYIDAGMVGSMGANATASIGLVSSTTWLIGGSCIGLSAGFYVQIAQLIGAGRDSEAENVLRQGLKTVVVLGILISVLCYAIGGSLPRWLGGDREIWSDSSAYFRVYCLAVPFVLLGLGAKQITNKNAGQTVVWLMKDTVTNEGFTARFVNASSNNFKPTICWLAIGERA